MGFGDEPKLKLSKDQWQIFIDGIEERDKEDELEEEIKEDE